MTELDDGSVPAWSIDIPEHLSEEIVQRVVGQDGFIMRFDGRRVVWPIDLHASQWIQGTLKVLGR